MINRVCRGSISIFGVLVLVLVAECLLVLIEGARLEIVKQSARLQSELAVEGAFANYCSILWEEYHLLGNDISDMESLIVSGANGRTSEFEWRKNLLEFDLKTLDIKGYTLLTDGGGMAYKNVVSDYMKDNILYEAAKTIYGQYEVIQDILNSDESDLEDIDTALESIGSVNESVSSKRIAARGGMSDQSVANDGVSAIEGIRILEDITKLQNTGILELLIDNTKNLSGKSFDRSRSVSERTLAKGKNYQIGESEWLDRVLLQQYTLTYLSAYGNEKEDRALSYEIEYLIGGKKSDIENLRIVAERLLLIRLAANMLYLLNDSAKVEEAKVLALVIAVACQNPELTELIQAALLTAWGFGESIMDLRGILQGKRIPLLKSDETWTLQLTQIGEIMEGSFTAKESETGLTYSDYLGVLLLFSKDTTIAMRSMDMQEATIRSQSGDTDFGMDQLIIQTDVVMTYEYKPIFQFFDSLSVEADWNQEIKQTVDYRYGS